MSIKRSLILSLIALAAIALPMAAKDVPVQSVWTAAPVTIDGVAQEWNDAAPVFDKASGAQYAVKNDGKDLYIIMVLRQESTLQYTGMKIFAGAAAEKNPATGILFIQKMVTADELIASLEKKGQKLTEEQRAEIRKKPTHPIFLEEPILPKGASAPAGTPEPAQFRSIEKNRVTVLEFKFPLSRIAGGQPGADIKLGFEWGGMTKEIRKEIMANRAASGAEAHQGQVAMSVSDTSGDGGGGGPDFSFNRDPRYKKYSFKIDVKLASDRSER
jgi:hypothetical protein